MADPRPARPPLEPTSDPAIHRAELARFAAFLALTAALWGATYLAPWAEPLRPWAPGDPVPLAHLARGDSQVREDREGVVERIPVAVPAPAPAPAPLLAAGPEPACGGAQDLPPRDPALPTPIEAPPGSLDAAFGALARAESGGVGQLVRILHWGDSTIAADGIVGTARRRLQERFGDGGPGFLAVRVDPRWSVRHDVDRRGGGDWTTFNLTEGDAPGRRYGLAGVVAVAGGAASVTLGGRKVGEGVRQGLHRFDLHYQVQPGGGTLEVSVGGTRRATLRTAAPRRGEAFHEVRVPEGAPSVRVAARGDGPVTVYGVALETAGGLTWENFGVAGSSVASMGRQRKEALAEQVRRRDPALLIYQTGGNELTWPSVVEGDGEAYRRAYLQVLATLRAGAPGASCLVVGPIDQATRTRKGPASKPKLGKMIDLQRSAAREAGCAFWDARHVMGGEGGFARWLEAKPRLALSDLMHLTRPGLDLVGESLADALLGAYDCWKRSPRPLPASR